MRRRDAQPARRRSLGYSEAGEQLHVSFGDEDEVTNGKAEPMQEPISPGWLARDRAKQQVAREKQRQRSRPDSIAVRARAMNTRVEIREADSVRAARATQASAALLSSTSFSSPRSPRSPRAASLVSPKPRDNLGSAHSARPWASQRAVGKTAEESWKRSSATEYVRSLQSLSETLNHPRPLVQVTTRQSLGSTARRERIGVAATTTGRMSATEFVRKLQDTSLRSGRADASSPPRQQPKQTAESGRKVAAASTPEPEPAVELRTPARDPAPVTAQTASSFTEWYAANRSGGSSSSPVPTPEPAPEPETRRDTGANWLLQPASPSPSRSPGQASPFDQRHSPSQNGARVTGGVSPVPGATAATVGSNSVMQYRSYGGSMPEASPRTIERRQRVTALALAARWE